MIAALAADVVGVTKLLAEQQQFDTTVVAELGL